MSPHEVVTIDEDEAMPTSSSPISSRNGGSPRSGRVLYCRKCEGHGEKVILKNHAPSCPYILCTCRSCERLNQKRLKSFNKRNKEKLELAAILTEQRRRERERERDELDYQAPSRKLSSCSSNSSTMDSEQGSIRTGLEGRSMSLGAMTVMSYDIWKAKCAAEKKRQEAEGRARPPSPLEAKPDVPMRKRAHTFIAPRENKEELPKLPPPSGNEKKGRYILLPTIPAMRIFVDEDMEKKMDDKMDYTPPGNPPPTVENQVSEMKINSPVAVKPVQSITSPQMATTCSVPLQQNFIKPTVPMTLPSLPVAPSLTIAPPLPRTQPLTFTPATTTAPAPAPLSAEQVVLIQNSILQQQNQALQQLLSLLPINNPTPPTTTPSPDLLTILKCQQIVNPPRHIESMPQDLIQSLLANRQQAIFSHSM